MAGWPPGKAFEHIILRCFELASAEVTYPFEVQIDNTPVEQIDGAVRTDRVYMLVESKHHKTRIDVEPIAKIKNQLSRRPAGIVASVFSMNGFSEPAKILTRHTHPLNVLLWEKEETEAIIIDAIRGAARPIDALHQKYKFAVERAMPDYNIMVGY